MGGSTTRLTRSGSAPATGDGDGADGAGPVAGADAKFCTWPHDVLSLALTRLGVWGIIIMFFSFGPGLRLVRAQGRLMEAKVGLGRQRHGGTALAGNLGLEGWQRGVRTQ
jgi:hypothetical protein